MIRLDKTNRSLGIVLGGAVATSELNTVVSFTEKEAVADTASAYLLGQTQLATTNGATDVTICDAPAQKFVRDIDYVSVRNRDTAAVTVSIEYDDNGTDTVIYSATLAVGDTLVYTDQSGWDVLDSSGRKKTSAGVGVPGTSTDNAVARWDGAGGGTLQNSAFVVDDSGHVTSFGGNIAFPATQAASAGANVLDDYEEGAWTPSVGGDATYTEQTGRYTKIGRVVYIEYDITINVLGTGSVSTLSGLPFANNGTTDGTIPVSFISGIATNVVFIVGYIAPSGSTMAYQTLTAAGATTGGTNVFANATRIIGGGHYTV